MQSATSPDTQMSMPAGHCTLAKPLEQNNRFLAFLLARKDRLAGECEPATPVRQEVVRQ